LGRRRDYVIMSPLFFTCKVYSWIRPYGSLIWNPNQNYLNKKLEKVQNRFLRMLSNKYHKCDSGILLIAMIVTEFNIKSLKFRRLYSDLLWFYNLLISKIDCPEMLSSIPLNLTLRYLNVPNITLRFNPTFHIPTRKKKLLYFRFS